MYVYFHFWKSPSNIQKISFHQTLQKHVVVVCWGLFSAVNQYTFGVFEAAGRCGIWPK